VKLDHGGARRVDRISEAGLDRGELTIEAAHIGQEIGGQAFAFTLDQALGTDTAEQFRRPIGRHRRGAPPATSSRTTACSLHAAWVRNPIRSS